MLDTEKVFPFDKHKFLNIYPQSRLIERGHDLLLLDMRRMDPYISSLSHAPWTVHFANVTDRNPISPVMSACLSEPDEP